jgi:hypothetical protein
MEPCGDKPHAQRRIPMSMHAIEDIVEWSIVSLDKSKRAASLDCRSLFKSLYDFQSKYDTGFTHFRVMAQLIKHRFVYVFAVEEHPDYDLVKPPLDGGNFLANSRSAA